LPIIAMTANAMKSDVEACLAVGMNDFVSKPIERAALVQSLRRRLPARIASASPESVAGTPLSKRGRQLDQQPARPAQEPVLAGIDVVGTVGRLGIPFEKLRPVILRFGASQRKTLEELRNAVAQKDAAGARRHAHALAGAAMNLGADELGTAAKNLEMSAAQGNSDLAGLFHRVDERAALVFGSIDSLATSSSRSDRLATEASLPADPLVVRAQLEQLRSALADSDLSGSSQILEGVLRFNLPEDCRKQMALVRESMDAYEYDK